MNAHVEAFFDPATYTYSYVVSDPAPGQCALIVSIHRNSIDTGKMRRSSLDPTFLLA